MPPDQSDTNRDLVLFMDMLTAARAVAAFVKGRSFEEYKMDLFFRSAVERQVEIVGEAARSVSKITQLKYVDIPWRAIAAQRHRLAHEYGAINDEIIWKVATVHIPILISQLAAIVGRTE